MASSQLDTNIFHPPNFIPTPLGVCNRDMLPNWTPTFLIHPTSSPTSLGACSCGRLPDWTPRMRRKVYNPIIPTGPITMTQSWDKNILIHEHGHSSCLGNNEPSTLNIILSVHMVFNATMVVFFG